MNAIYPKVLVKPVQYTEIIRKSTFTAIIGRADTPEQAREFIDCHSVTEATHNCWAYYIGGIYRFHDDGEPRGTAGKPILTAIQGQSFDCTVALVIRFFGGTKLGVGGLARAYGGVVSHALHNAPCECLIPQCTVTFQVPFEYAQRVYRAAHRYQAVHRQENYTSTGVKQTWKLPVSERADFVTTITNLTRGQAVFEQ